MAADSRQQSQGLLNLGGAEIGVRRVSGAKGVSGEDEHSTRYAQGADDQGTFCDSSSQNALVEFFRVKPKPADAVSSAADTFCVPDHDRE